VIVTAKSVIFDITDNWGDSYNVGIRSVEFWLNGVRHDLLPADFSAYATSFINDDFKPEYTFDTSVSKVGSAFGTSWAASSPTSQRLICVFNNPIQFDEIRISNFHDSGQLPGIGARTTVTTISSDAVSDTTYKAGILNSSEIFNGVLEAHVEDDVTDEQSINPSFDKVVPTALHTGSFSTANSSIEPSWPPGYKSVIIDIADNWGNEWYVGIRSVEFWLNGVRHDLLPADFSAYATSFLDDVYHPKYTFDTSVSKTGIWVKTQLVSGGNAISNFRLICVFNNPIQFNEIRVCNSHDAGSSDFVTTGAKNVTLSGSRVRVTDTTYSAPVPYSDVLFEGILEKHIAEDVPDEHTVWESLDKVAATIVHASNWRQLQPALSYPAPTHINTLKPFPLELPYRDPVTRELAALYLADAMDMLVPINIADINLSGNAGCHVQLSISPVYLDAIAGSAPPYSIRDGHGNRVYSIPDIEWSMYSGAKNTGLVVTGRTTADRQRAPHHRSVPAPKSLSPTPQHQIAHIPGAWDIVPEDTVSAGGLFVSVVDSVAIHVERGNSRSTVYG
jgi:hypothetical protein